MISNMTSKLITPKWILMSTVAAAALTFTGPATAEPDYPDSSIVVADDYEPADSGDDSKMDSEAAAPDTADSDDGPAMTENDPNSAVDAGEMEGAQVAPDTAMDDSPAQASDPDAVEEEDSSMDNEEVGDPSTD